MKLFKAVNIIVGKPLVEPWYVFCKDKSEWNIIKDDIYYTSERFLPKIMVDLGVVKSISEVKRNNSSFVCDLNEPNYLELKWGKNRMFILVGK